MDTKCEVVRVLSDHSLIDSESYEHNYRTPHALMPGFYVVIWPPGAFDPRYDDEAQFIGPYRGRALAEGILESRLWEALDRPGETAECAGVGVGGPGPI